MSKSGHTTMQHMTSKKKQQQRSIEKYDMSRYTILTKFSCCWLFCHSFYSSSASSFRALDIFSLSSSFGWKWQKLRVFSYFIVSVRVVGGGVFILLYVSSQFKTFMNNKHDLMKRRAHFFVCVTRYHLFGIIVINEKRSECDANRWLMRPS